MFRDAHQDGTTGAHDILRSFTENGHDRRLWQCHHFTINATTKMGGLTEIIANAAESESISNWHKKDIILRQVCINIVSLFWFVRSIITLFIQRLYRRFFISKFGNILIFVVTSMVYYVICRNARRVDGCRPDGSVHRQRRQGRARLTKNAATATNTVLFHTVFCCLADFTFVF